MKKLPLFLLVMLAACGKGDVVLPEIAVSSPGENQVFQGGQTVTIQATVTDNEGIHMVHLAVTDNHTGGHMVHFEEHYDGKTYQLNKSFPTQAGRSYTIEIEATDHAENKAKKTITVSAN